MHTAAEFFAGMAKARDHGVMDELEKPFSDIMGSSPDGRSGIERAVAFGGAFNPHDPRHYAVMGALIAAIAGLWYNYRPKRKKDAEEQDDDTDDDDDDDDDKTPILSWKDQRKKNRDDNQALDDLPQEKTRLSVITSIQTVLKTLREKALHDLLELVRSEVKTSDELQKAIDDATNICNPLIVNVEKGEYKGNINRSNWREEVAWAYVGDQVPPTLPDRNKDRAAFLLAPSDEDTYGTYFNSEDEFYWIANIMPYQSQVDQYIAHRPWIDEQNAITTQSSLDNLKRPAGIQDWIFKGVKYFATQRVAAFEQIRELNEKYERLAKKVTPPPDEAGSRVPTTPNATPLLPEVDGEEPGASKGDPEEVDGEEPGASEGNPDAVDGGGLMPTSIVLGCIVIAVIVVILVLMLTATRSISVTSCIRPAHLSCVPPMKKYVPSRTMLRPPGALHFTTGTRWSEE